MLHLCSLVALAVVGVATAAVIQCLEHPTCQEINSESSNLESIQCCRYDLTTVTPATPGDANSQTFPPSDPASPLALPFLSSSASPQGRRSYAIEHFRWGKPVGRKQPKVKVYTSTSVEEDSAEVLPGKMRRQEPAGENKAAENAAMGLELAEEDQEKLPSEVHQKKDGKYKIKHFRWSRPPASRRHSGLTRSREAQPEAAAHAPQKRGQHRWTGAGERGKRGIEDEQPDGPTSAPKQRHTTLSQQATTLCLD